MICGMGNQMKMDARKSPSALFEIRKHIVRLHKKGVGPMAIKEQTGISWGAIRKAIDLFEAGGVRALKPMRRGCKKGAARTLTPEQEKQVQKDICDKRPEQMKMDFALWMREAVLIYIREHFGVDMPMRTAGEYLKRWGSTPQKPVKVAYEQKPEAVKKWLGEEYPAISARARAESAEIHWADERLNADLKHAITVSVPRRTRQGVLKKMTEHMNMVKSSPERVKTYFTDKHVAYAADSQ